MERLSAIKVQLELELVSDFMCNLRWQPKNNDIIFLINFLTDVYCFCGLIYNIYKQIVQSVSWKCQVTLWPICALCSFFFFSIVLVAKHFYRFSGSFLDRGKTAWKDNRCIAP